VLKKKEKKIRGREEESGLAVGRTGPREVGLRERKKKS
jgi:hypothetical protein